MKEKLRFEKKYSSLSRKSVDFTFLKDLFLFIFLIFSQEVLLSSIFHTYRIDLLTPFLSFYIITANKSHTIFFIIMIALSLELLTTVPVGFYFCFWFVSTQIIWYLKEHLTWKKSLAWYLICLANTLCLFSLEQICRILLNDISVLVMSSFCQSLLIRLSGCLFLSLLLFKKLSFALTKDKFD